MNGNESNVHTRTHASIQLAEYWSYTIKLASFGYLGRIRVPYMISFNFFEENSKRVVHVRLRNRKYKLHYSEVRWND